MRFVKEVAGEICQKWLVRFVRGVTGEVSQEGW